jgi:cysteinyl-tRNA synthetase
VTGDDFTDVDDKIIKRANEIGADPQNSAEHYMQEYRKNLDDLNVTLVSACHQ